MRLDRVTQDLIEITLSERNLAAMLSKVQRKGSLRTMMKTEGEYLLILRGEDDEKHYGQREYPAGEVHPLDVPVKDETHDSQAQVQ